VSGTHFHGAVVLHATIGHHATAMLHPAVLHTTTLLHAFILAHRGSFTGGTAGTRWHAGFAVFHHQLLGATWPAGFPAMRQVADPAHDGSNEQEAAHGDKEPGDEAKNTSKLFLFIFCQ